jgi:hypothetical protein
MPPRTPKTIIKIAYRQKKVANLYLAGMNQEQIKEYLDKTEHIKVERTTISKDIKKVCTVDIGAYECGAINLHDGSYTAGQYIAVACSGRGTVVRINTSTGAILGEYWSAPENRGRNPSRTTVDFYGNVWVGNRDESDGGKGSVIKIGVVEGGAS